jgi:hypothetical protein
MTADLVRTHADLLRQVRSFHLSRVADLSDEQLRLVPQGFGNNVLWNLAHLAVTQQLLIYGRAGLPLYVSDQLVDENRKGTSPANWTAPPDPTEIKALLLDLPRRMAEDAERFTAYQPYTTSAGVTLGTVEDALRFNLYHEGLHGGAIGALVRAVSS